MVLEVRGGIRISGGVDNEVIAKFLGFLLAEGESEVELHSVVLGPGHSDLRCVRCKVREKSFTFGPNADNLLRVVVLDLAQDFASSGTSSHDKDVVSI